MRAKTCPVQILIFGDSILKGVRYENGGYHVEHDWHFAVSDDFGVNSPIEFCFWNTIG